MFDQTKIQLSSFEKDLLCNPEWILTKNRIIQKAKHLLEEVEHRIMSYTSEHPFIFPDEVKIISPKISRGENYLGFPWLILDYPRFFEKEHVFAIRNLFWWGNYFSTTLHLSGRYKQQAEGAIINAYMKLNDFYTCIHDEQWQHHLEKENYKPVKEFTADGFSEHIQQRSFIKLSGKISFSNWEAAIDLLTGNFIQLAECLA